MPLTSQVAGRPGTRSRAGQQSRETQCKDCRKPNKIDTLTANNQLSYTSHLEKKRTKRESGKEQEPGNEPTKGEENALVTIEISDSESENENERFEHTVVSESSSDSETANVKAKTNRKEDARKNILEASTCSELSSSDSDSSSSDSNSSCSEASSSSGRSSRTESLATTAEQQATNVDPCMAELEQDTANLTASWREDEEEHNSSSKGKAGC